MISRIIEKLKRNKKETIGVKIVIDNCDYFPQRQTEGAAGYDLRAAIEDPVVLEPNVPMMFGTGLRMEIPDGYHGKICIRSSMGKKGITIPNSPAIIDSDYRDEVKIVLVNISKNNLVILPKERIAQILIEKNCLVHWSIVCSLSPTKRNLGGFGSTGAI